MVTERSTAGNSERSHLECHLEFLAGTRQRSAGAAFLLHPLGVLFVFPPSHRLKCMYLRGNPFRSSDLRGTSPHGSVPSGSLSSIIDKRSLRQKSYILLLSLTPLLATFFHTGTLPQRPRLCVSIAEIDQSSQRLDTGIRAPGGTG